MRRGGKTLYALTGARNLLRKRSAESTPAQDRREALIMLAVVVLFVANVVLYLFHHWNLTSANEARPLPRPIAPRVIID